MLVSSALSLVVFASSMPSVTPSPPGLSIRSGGSSLSGGGVALKSLFSYPHLDSRYCRLNETAMPPSTGTKPTESGRCVTPILCEVNTPLMPATLLGA